jgi:hypothetical protein
MANGTKDDDIREVMAEEKSRGRRPRDAEAQKLRKERMDTIRMILGLRREADAIEAIRLLGHGDDSEELERILKAWRALSSSRKR